MAPIQYKITIKNGSNGIEAKTYYLYVAKPTVSGGTPIQLQWDKTTKLGNNAQWAFRFTQETFGFAGTCQAPTTSGELGPGDPINLQSSLPVSVGSFGNDGTELMVTAQNDLTIRDDGMRNSLEKTFSITSDVHIPQPNFYVVGVARKSDQAVNPVTAFQCKPGQKIVITPGQAVYVARAHEDKENGTVINVAEKVGKVEFQGVMKEAIVTELPTGEFTVTYA